MLPIQTLRRAKKLVATLGGKNKIYFKKSCYFSLCFFVVFCIFVDLANNLLIWQMKNLVLLLFYTKSKKSCSSERESAFPHWKWNFSLKSQKNGCIFRPKSCLFEGGGYCIFSMMPRQQNLSHNPQKLWACGVVGVGAYGHTLSGYSLSQKSQNPQKWAIGSLRLSRLIGLSAHICAFCESYSYHRAM